MTNDIKLVRQPGSSLSFNNQGAPQLPVVEVLRFCEDGRVFVRGELVDDNPAIYAAFKAWLATCTNVETRREPLS